MYEDEFVKRLCELRQKKGVSARDMSLSLGQNSGYINHIENKQTLPSLTVFFNICEYFNITPFEFFETDSKNPFLLEEALCELKGMSDDQLNHLIYLLKYIKKTSK